MSQIKTKFIEDLAITTAKINNAAVDSTKLASNAVTASAISADSIDGSKVRLANDQYLRARNAANDGDVDIVKADSSDNLTMASSLTVSGDLLATQADISPSSGLTTQIWGADVPGLVLDGNTTEASTAAGSGIILDSDGATSDLLIVSRDQSSANSSSGVFMGSGNTNGTGSSGYVNLQTGAATGSSGNSGALDIFTSLSANGNSGNITLSSGQASNGTSGNISLSVGSGSSQGDIKFLKSGVPSVSGQVWTASSTDGTGYWATPTPALTSEKETFVLDGTDITNQYVDLANVAKASSITFVVKGGAPTIEAYSGSTTEHDYTVSLTGGAGGNTRISFANDLATGGASALIAGDIVQVQYTY